MPNQLSKTKRRQSLAEHSAVLAALASIARREKTTVMALLREAAREAVRKRAVLPEQVNELRAVVRRLEPRMPAQFKNHAHLSRFKRAQREFDQVILDLKLAAPAEVQDRNSLVRASQPLRLLNFAQAHASI